MDLNAIKSRLTALQNKKGGGPKEDRTKTFWKPSVGKQVIRIVPSKFNKQNPFREVMFHYGIGNKTMVSLTNFGEKDPIVEFASQLRKTSDKENWALAKKISPKMRVFVPVVVRGEEEKGVRLWEFGKEMYLELLSIAEDEDIADYTDVMDGRDMTIDTVGPEVTGTKYNKSSVRIKPKTSALSEDNEQIKKWISEQPDVLQHYKKYEFEEMKNILMEWLEPTETEEAAVEETQAPAPSSFALNTSAKKKGFDEEEFDDLFND
jgi:hypothetical protein